MIQMLSGQMRQVFKQFIDEIAARHGVILEVGTGYGESARFFGKLKPEWTVFTVDAFGLYGDGRIYQQYNHETVKKILDDMPPNVIQILGDSPRVRLPIDMAIDVLYLDASHTYEGLKADWENYMQYVKLGGVIIIDDYLQPGNPTNGVKRFCDELPNPVLYQCDRFIILDPQIKYLP